MAINKATYSIILFKKQPKADATFPLKLRITFERKQKYYGIGWSFNENTWSKINSSKARLEYRDIKLKLLEIENKAKKVIDYFDKTDDVFSFARFEEIFFNQQNNTDYVFEAYKTRIEELKADGKISTALSLSCALKSFETHFKNKSIKFRDITVKVLNEYEDRMIEHGNSASTISIYLRSLRALFNRRIAKGLLDSAHYPFGRYKFQIPSTETRDKVISKEELEKLYNYQPEQGSLTDQAKDLWFFMYLCNGMNLKDMCRLKYSAFKNDYFVYIRAKTEGKSKIKKEITVILNDEVNRIIKKWGNDPADANTYVFKFFYNGINPNAERRITQNLTSVINDHMNKIATALKLDIHITTYSARQTFSNVLLNSDAPIKLISDSLGHTNSAVTEKHYLKKMSNEKLKQFANELLNFEK